MTVFLVGGGPGDPGLLTLRGAELLRTADVVLHDKLIPMEALELCRPDAELVDVGKIGGGEQVPQDVTTRLLVEHGLTGRTVVRLKGGDPFVFGRGGEEAQALRAAGVPFEVVPGITAGIAAPAYAGIPVTQRLVSSAVAFVTGHEDPAKPETMIDWPALAAFPGTLCFYMGVRQLGRITEQLVAGGRPAGQPCAIVQSGTLPGQRAVHATLGTLAEVAAEARVRAPAITVVGDVAALGDELAWLAGARPLGGVSVAVTRARAQASELARRLRTLGAQVVEAPTIRTVPLDATLPALAGVDLLVVTSPTGAERLLELCGGDARRLAGPTLAAIGPGTAAALRKGGAVPDVVPERSASEGLIEAFGAAEIRRAVVVRAREGRELFREWLEERGASVELLAVYETQPVDLAPELRDAVLGCDYALFASGSSARSLHASAGGSLAGPRVVSIGPATTGVLRELGAEPAVEAAVHTPDGLVDALLADAAARR